jgi:dTDP-D-glucose 4,6-dehydratase
MGIDDDIDWICQGIFMYREYEEKFREFLEKKGFSQDKIKEYVDYISEAIRGRNVNLGLKNEYEILKLFYEAMGSDISSLEQMYDEFLYIKKMTGEKMRFSLDINKVMEDGRRKKIQGLL